MWGRRKFYREGGGKVCISESNCYSDRERAVPKLPRARELLTLLILNVPEKFHSRKSREKKSLQSRVHGTPVPTGHSPCPGRADGVCLNLDPPVLCSVCRSLQVMVVGKSLSSFDLGFSISNHENYHLSRMPRTITWHR